MIEEQKFKIKQVKKFQIWNVKEDYIMDEVWDEEHAKEVMEQCQKRYGKTFVKKEDK